MKMEQKETLNKLITDDSEINNISVCDVMKANTSKIIKKLEAQIPSYVQNYSDLYSENLHLLDDIFGTCYISEKEFFDKLNIDQKTLKTLGEYWNYWAKISTSQIDISTNFMKSYVKMRISQIKLFDNYVHQMMDSYSKRLSDFNRSLKT